MFVKYSHENFTVSTDLGINMKIEGKMSIEVDVMQLAETINRDGNVLIELFVALNEACYKAQKKIKQGTGFDTGLN